MAARQLVFGESYVQESEVQRLFVSVQQFLEKEIVKFYEK